ncbi:MAG: hypothetical protein GX031_14185 [Candidatus Riflebacteria bacterium]|nr:hypothetical protein [Candidatus Riflebacteria bacterium]
MNNRDLTIVTATANGRKEAKEED